MTEATATLKDKHIILTFDYNLDTLDMVRDIDGRTYDSGTRVWKIPATPWHANEVVNRLSGYFRVDPAIARLSKKPRIQSRIEYPDGLYDFQKEGVNFIALSKGRCIVADEMGLGKTVEALSYVKLFGGQTLIVAPATVVFKWLGECKKWVPEKKAAAITNKRSKLPKADILIMSYAIMVARFNQLKTIPFDVGIWDEAHYLKNYKAQRTRVAQAIVRAGLPKVLFLSGTPFMNRPDELFSLLNMIDPIGFSNYYHYALRYCGAQRIDGQLFFPKGVVTNVQELAKRLESYMVRRTKRDVLSQLPDLSRSYLPIDIPNMVEYIQAKKDLTDWLKSKDKNVKNKAHVLTRLGALRQIVGEGKVAASVELAQDILDAGRKVVLFCHHKEVVRQLYQGLKTYGVRIIEGATSQEDRNAFSNEFLIPDSQIHVMIITTAGSEGIDLYSASDIIVVERQWVPAKEEQAEARLHRIGQKNPVTAYYIVAKDTIDEKLNDLVQSKRSVFQQVIHSDEILEELLEDL